MRPQDIVAMILAIGVVLVLLSGTTLNLLWLTPQELGEAQEGFNSEMAATFWKDIINVILGALAGYIAGKNHNDK